MNNQLTIDVEDYYHVSGMQSVIHKEEWENYPSRVEENTRRLLHLLRIYRVRATFFILGIVAEQHPKLVKEIQQSGHEIASHGYDHALLYTLNATEFLKDVGWSKRLLEDITGQPILGYRAPSFSITEKTPWVPYILLNEGFLYDSSVYPSAYARNGTPSGQRIPHVLCTMGERILWEFPLPTYRIFGKNVPVAGGGYFRFFPYCVTKACIRSLNQHGIPVVIYLHPWELDPNQPRLKPELANRFRHYLNLHKTELRLTQLLRDFTFTTISESCPSKAISMYLGELPGQPLFI